LQGHDEVIVPLLVFAPNGPPQFSLSATLDYDIGHIGHLA